MSMNYAGPGPAASAQHMHQHRGSPVLATATSPHAMPTHLRGNYNPASSYTQSAPNPNWYNPNVSTSHGSSLQQALGQSQSSSKVSGGAATPDTKSEDWDETFLAVLGTQDPRQLRELLARSNPEVVMPMNGAGPLSQAVVLTLVHRVSDCNMTGYSQCSSCYFLVVRCCGRDFSRRRGVQDLLVVAPACRKHAQH
jgi:hypothetical protein